MTSLSNSVCQPLVVYYIDFLRVRVVARNPAAAIYHYLTRTDECPRFNIEIFGNRQVAIDEYNYLQGDNYVEANYLPVAVASVTVDDIKYFVYEVENDSRMPLVDGAYMVASREPRLVGRHRFNMIIDTIADEDGDAFSLVFRLGTDAYALTPYQLCELATALTWRRNIDRYMIMSLLRNELDPETYRNHVQRYACPTSLSGRVCKNFTDAGPDRPLFATRCVHCHCYPSFPYLERLYNEEHDE
jgi:hypothetical protein